MIAAILLTALVVGFFWSEDHRALVAQRDRARLERDEARTLAHPSARHLRAVRGGKR